MRNNLVLLSGWLLLTIVSAKAATFGSWEVGTSSDSSDEVLYAATVNDSGALLGQFCVPSTGSCIWILGMSTGCEQGHQYPVLANSDAGATQLNVVCNARLESGLYRYVFSEFDIVDDIVKKGARVGFAVPLQKDQFKVVRFRLDGSSSALAIMQAAAHKVAEEKKAVPTRSNTRDLNM